MNAKLKEMLAREGVGYEVLSHREVYTAQERAAESHIAGRRLAKVVMVHDGECTAMAVIPAAARLDLEQLGALAGRPAVGLAREDDFARLFPDCDVGAMPPFGGLYGLTVFLDSALADGPDLVFEGGTHREEVRVLMHDYLRVESPTVGSLTASARAA